MSSRPTPSRPVRATRVTPPEGAGVVVSREPTRAYLLVVLLLLLMLSAGAATWFGSRAVRLQRELDRQTVLLDRSVARLSERDGLLSALFDADGALSVTHLVNDSTGAGVTVYWNRRDGRALVNAFGLPTLPRARTYALWIGDSLHTRLVTTFASDSRGRTLSRQFVLPPQRADTLRLLVTVEPASPGAVPNMPVLLTGVLPADSIVER